MNNECRLALYRTSLLIRILEETIAEQYPEWEMRCPTHLSIGQEAAAAGSCLAASSGDYAISGHRSHGHYIAKGGNLGRMMAEIFGKATGCAGGRGGSMHLVDLEAGFLGATPIVGSTIPIGVGAALGSKMKGEERVTLVFLGDGATETGVFHESLNFAALRNLAVVFLCENNLYSVYSPIDVRQPSGRQIVSLAEGHGIEVSRVDGNDAEAVYLATATAIEKSRKGFGPTFLELSTYRWREHCGPNFDNEKGYRTEEEVLFWRERDPIKVHAEALLSDGLTDVGGLNAIRESIQIEIDAAFAYARRSPFPDQETACQNVYASSQRIQGVKNVGIKQRPLSYVDSLREALQQSMLADETVYVMGLGVPDPVGVFGSTLGLVDYFGEDRVFDIPLSENAITGVALGSAITGFRPVMTHQRVDFALTAMEQIINQVAKWHYMFNGLMHVPVVIRMVIGRGWGQGPQHSQSLQAIFAHIPGLKVIMPTTAHDAKGMLIAAIEDNSPVIILEHRWLYDIEDVVPEEMYLVPLDKAKILHEGTDLTIVGISYMALEALRSVELLKDHGVSVEVIDLRSVRPLDIAGISSSVEKTGRLLVADTAHLEFGVSAEIIACITEHMGQCLKTNPRRIGSPSYPTPTSPALADFYYPRAPHIAMAVLDMLGKSTGKLSIEPPYGQRLDQPDPSFAGPF